MKYSTIVISFYNDPEKYPPTLNVVDELAEKFRKVILIVRKLNQPTWQYPKNVEVYYVNMNFTLFKWFDKLYKLSFFLKFVFVIWTSVIRRKPVACLAQDSIAALAQWIVFKIVNSKALFWYHNHDVTEKSKVGVLSVSWLSVVLEKYILARVDILTLPSTERLGYFNTAKFKGKYIFLPNYPKLTTGADDIKRLKEEDHQIKLIYQGTLGRNHGFEEIIKVLGQRLAGKTLYLTLIGPISASYKQELENIASLYETTKFFSILPPVSYLELQNITAQHHVGLAVHKPSNLIYSTGGTASNKIYEYISHGLPVILYNTPHYHSLLSKYKWAVFTDLTEESVLSVVSQIIDNYTEMSKAALSNFSTSLNYDVSFNAAFTEIQERIYT